MSYLTVRLLLALTLVLAVRCKPNSTPFVGGAAVATRCALVRPVFEARNASTMPATIPMDAPIDGESVLLLMKLIMVNYKSCIIHRLFIQELNELFSPFPSSVPGLPDLKFQNTGHFFQSLYKQKKKKLHTTQRTGE